tara:strand:+ start:4112 stop:4771 length:660 start_codon:yes stop_codon:yes gene_type:complete
MHSWIDKDTEIYCSFAREAGNTGCQMMNTAFYYHGLNKIYKSFSVRSIEDAVKSVLTLGIKGFAITMPYKVEVLKYVHDMEDSVKEIGAANTVINTNGRLHAYNTDAYAAKKFLSEYDNRKPLVILGNGGYAKAVKWAAERSGFTVEQRTRKENGIHMELGMTHKSIIYSCIPESLKYTLHTKSNEWIDCLVNTDTGKQLAKLQASKQFELYTGKEFPL